MTVDMFAVRDDDFLPCIEKVVTAGGFMDMTEDAQITFIWIRPPAFRRRRDVILGA